MTRSIRQTCVVLALLMLPGSSSAAAQGIAQLAPVVAHPQLVAPVISPDSTDDEDSVVFMFTAAGAMIGAGLAMIEANNCTGEWCFGPVLAAPFGALLGAAAGWFVGVIVEEIRKPDSAAD